VPTAKTVECRQDSVRVEPNHDEHIVEPCVHHLTNSAPDERLTPQRKEELRPAHASRGPGGKNDRADHRVIV